MARRSTTCRCRSSREHLWIGRRSESSMFRSTRRLSDRSTPPRAAGGSPTRSRPEALMETSTARAIHDPAADFYIDALQKLQDTGIPFLVGGAFAFSHYAHVPRDTKDIDVFVKPEDCPRVLEAFERMAYSSEMPF